MKTSFSSIFLLTNLLITSTIHTFSLNSIYGMFSSNKYEEAIQKEIPVKGQCAVRVENIDGSIELQTWKQNKVLIRATKRAPKEELLSNITVNTRYLDKYVVIKTLIKEPATQGLVEYKLLVPETFNVRIKGQTCPVKIENLNGRASIHIKSGDVQLNSVQGPSEVEIKEKGEIEIHQPNGATKAYTHHGEIEIHDAKASTFASTDKGKIYVSCKNIPEGSTINLDATRPISLELPDSVNADIQAECDKGSIYCQHYITIKPFITQLNPKAWAQFKRETNGCLGNGGAQILLHTASGNIRITKTTK